MNVNTSFLSNLNQEQKQAVLHTEGPLLILAGAGSGKTTVLVSRTGHILSQGLAKPEEILVLTFTNKAAKELKERVSSKLGKESKKIWAGTFHGWGLDFLKKNHKLAELPNKFGLLDATDSRTVIKELLADRKHSCKDNFDLETLQRVLSDLRATKKTPPNIDEAYLEMAEWLLPSYIAKMHSLGVIDFDGLILKPIELLKEHEKLASKYKDKYKYLMVDEFQDTNKIQMDLVLSVCNENQNLAVVGDDDQSIYGWRGAEIQNILGFPKLFKSCKVVRLETNYRSTPQILKMANSIINKIEERHQKTLIPFNSKVTGKLPEILIYDNEETECEEIAQLVLQYRRNGFRLNDLAILFRSNSQGALLEGFLRQANIDYEMTGGPSLIDRKEVRDVLAYLRSALFPNDICIRRILNTPNRGIGDNSIHKIIDYQKGKDISFLQALYKWREAEVNDKTGEQVQDFFGLLDNLKKTILQNQKPYADLLPEIFTNMGYRDYVLKSYKDKATSNRKWQLVEILGRILDGFASKTGKNEKTIRDFLDTLELRDISNDDSDQTEKVQLLTLHASKGLEFPIVILMGVDEGLIPHETLGLNIAEERRLFYVGVTRAKQELILTRCQQRKRYGKWRETAPSRFLCEVPESLVNSYEGGFRPLSEKDRVSLLADLYKKLDKNIELNNSK